MLVRVGKVTDVYASEGKVRVRYDDLDETSTKLPTMAAEYNLPKVGAIVLVLYTQNDSNGFVIGEFWNKVKQPSESNAATYKKQIGQGYIRGEGDDLKLFSPSITLEGSAGTVTLSQLVELMDRVAALEQRLGG